MKDRKDIIEVVVIEKLVHGGQGLTTLVDGRKAFVWNTLPGERVVAHFTRVKKDYAEGVATEILTRSPDRVEPKESVYLATSPWQIMTREAECVAKYKIVQETYDRENVTLPDFQMVDNDQDYGYRNKLEFSFYGDDQGLHYAFYNRGTHQKQIVEGSALALPSINHAAKDLLAELNTLNVRAGELKSVILRCQQGGKVVGALFVKPMEFALIELPDSLAGLKIYHSNPRSPASVATKLLHTIGDCNLADSLLNTLISYDVTGFFQVNIPVFKQALKQIEFYTKDAKSKVDMYAGVGTIGIPIVGTKALIELDSANVEMAKQNVGEQDIEVIQASTETALEYITNDACLIVDPPRSGLHKDVIAQIMEFKPERICYLSCNPATQARDIGLITEAYSIKAFEGYNFFPHTPHIETLAILERI